MSTPKWTKLPWKVVPTAIGLVVNAGSCRVARVVGDPDDDPKVVANANLIAAAPELYESLAEGNECDTPSFLEWLATRIVNIYGESENVDFVLALRRKAAKIRNAMVKARGEATPS